MKPYHNPIENLKSNRSVQLLERNKFAHLACHSGNDIYLVPISYFFEDGYLYSHSRQGHKIDMMRNNPNVCIQVEEVQDFFHWKSVVAWGHFEELKDDEATFAMRRLIQNFVNNEKRKSELEIDFAAQLESAIIYRVKIDRITGRYEDGEHDDSLDDINFDTVSF